MRQAWEMNALPLRLLVLGGFLCAPSSWVAETGASPAAKKPASAQVEPSNAKELAEKKAAEDKAVDAKFQAWKATRSLEQRKWEETLEACLGSFYCHFNSEGYDLLGGKVAKEILGLLPAR